jgi:outer membrane protein assembly factor BamB
MPRLRRCDRGVVSALAVRPRNLEIVLILAITTSLRAGQPAANWPQFLGPQRNGTSQEKGLNWDWKKQPPRTLWKVPLGSGFSSLTVVGERVFTLAKRGSRDIVVCLSAQDGRELWSYDAAPSYIDFQRQGAGPRSTPTYHDGKLYCLFAAGELVCLTVEGKRVWEKNIFRDSGAAPPPQKIFYWGVSFSPLVVDNLVIVQPGGSEDSSVVAFHKDTGQIAWKTGSDPIGYSSPIMISVHGTRQLVCPTGTSCLGIDLAKGTILWRYAFGNEFKTNCANPVWSDNLLFLSAAYGTGCAVLDLIKTSDGSWEVKEKWRDKKLMQNLFATSIILDKTIYGCSGDLRVISLRCLDLETGTMHWEERLPERAHLLAVDGRILLWDEHGNLRFFDVNPLAFQSRGEISDLLRFKSWAAPALAGGRLYVRDEHHALCVDLRK